jgi:hypothetical protein
LEWQKHGDKTQQICQQCLLDQQRAGVHPFKIKTNPIDCPIHGDPRQIDDIDTIIALQIYAFLPWHEVQIDRERRKICKELHILTIDTLCNWLNVQDGSEKLEILERLTWIDQHHNPELYGDSH